MRWLDQRRLEMSLGFVFFYYDRLQLVSPFLKLFLQRHFKANHQHMVLMHVLLVETRSGRMARMNYFLTFIKTIKQRYQC